MTRRVVTPSITKPVPGPAANPFAAPPRPEIGPGRGPREFRPSPAPRLHALEPGGGGPAASVAMPTPVTELADMLAGDPTLCVRRPGTPDVAPASAPAGPALAALGDCADAPSDAQFARIIEVWPLLSPRAQAALAAVVDALVEG